MPNPIGGNDLYPVQLSLEQLDLCNKLNLLSPDSFDSPSDMFKGALFATRLECRNNSDWMAQAAHSLREIFYPIWKGSGDVRKNNIKLTLEGYGSAKSNDSTLVSELSEIFAILNDIAHHSSKPNIVQPGTFTAKDFEKFLERFEREFLKALVRQADVHKEIDSVTAAGPPQLPLDNGIPQPII